MKRIIVFIVTCFLIVNAVLAQKVDVYDRTMKLNIHIRKGLATDIELDTKYVKAELKSYLRQFGKVKSEGKLYVVEQGRIPGINNGNAVHIYAITKTKGDVCEVFMAFDLGEEFLTSNSKDAQKGKKVVHDFGVLVYRKDVQQQIEDAERALKEAVKNHESEIKTGMNLQKSLNKAHEDSLQLEQKIIENGAYQVELEAEIVTNKESQEVTTGEVQKMQEALEVVRDKLNHIE